MSDEVYRHNIATADDYLEGKWHSEDHYAFELGGKTATIDWHALSDLGAGLSCNIDCTGETAFREWLGRLNRQKSVWTV